MRFPRYFAVKVIAVVSLSLTAFSQQPPQQQDQDDAFDPDSVNRGVARISVMNGDVSVQRGDSDEIVAAAINAPLVVGDRVLTGPNARAEVQFDSANMIRIASDSEIRLAELADRRYQIQLARGMATFRVLRASEADVEVSTPQVSIRPKKEGVYRIMVRDENESEVTVRVGEVEVFTPRGVETLRAGRTMQVRGTASDPEYQIISATGEDEWDRWNRNRDQDLQRSQSPQYVSRDVYGAEDLDNYGQWVSDPEYGNVWSPRVAAGWAPYREGRWSWIDWYGWSWVSYDPWGWAPYHYGRWYQSPSFGWCWYPGGIRARHSWSPGLVAFVGFGGGFNNVGWVPLAPRERYNRWYGRGYYGGNRGFSNLNVNVNIHNTFRNARNGIGVSAIDGARFGRGGSGRAWRSSDGDLQRSNLVRGQLPVTPGRESLRLSDREVRNRTAPRSSANERFVSRRPPTRVERVPFEQQRRNIEQARVGGSGFNQSSPGLNQSNQRTDGGNRDRQSSGAWRRFGEPSTGSSDRGDRSNPRIQQSGATTQTQRSPEARTQGGWSSFGEPGANNRNARSLQSQPERQAQPRTERSGRDTTNDSWRRFESRPASNSDAPTGRSGGSPRNDGNTFGRPERQMNSYPNGGSRNSAPEPVRISPPVVRERSMSRPESAPVRSTPRSEAPRQTQRNESARPSGGNGNRGNGGNSGGGGRSESRRSESGGGRRR